MSDDVRLAFPMARTCPFGPPPEYAQARDTGPLSRVTLVGGDEAWFVTGHEYASELLRDPRVSKNGLRDGYPEQVLDQKNLVKAQRGFLVWMDPPEHTVYRRMVAAELTVRKVATWAPHVTEIVNEQIDHILELGGTVDLVQELSLPVPSKTICSLLGVPYEARLLFQESTAATVRYTTTQDARQNTVGELRGYLADLLDEKRRAPKDDLFSRLVARFDAETPDAEPELLVGLAMNVLVGGHITTAGMISLGTLALLENPDQLAAIQADPSLLPNAVEELLRYFSVADPATHRIATEDIEIDGHLIKAGEGLMLPNAAANHDPVAWDRPGELDVTRDVRQHLAFGGGVHQCVGQNLSRMELGIVYSTLFERIPTLRLATPIEEIPFKYASALFGAESLPVTW